jgi:hypothetical protein
MVQHLSGNICLPNVPKDVYRQHENCRCIVEYVPGGVKRQNVHTEQWTDDREADKIEARALLLHKIRDKGGVNNARVKNARNGEI